MHVANLSLTVGFLVQDEIVVTAGRVMGESKLSSLASAAERREDWWLAARYWSVLSFSREHPRQQHGCYRAALDALGRATASGSWRSHETIEDEGEIKLNILGGLGATGDFGEQVNRLSEYEACLNTQAAVRNPIAAASLRWFLEIALMGDLTATQKHNLALTRGLCEGARTHPDSNERDKCVWVASGLVAVSLQCVTMPEFDWCKEYGEAGSMLLKCHSTYNYDVTHSFMNSSMNCDWCICIPSLVYPLLIHFGDVTNSLAIVDQCMHNCMRAAEEQERAMEVMGFGSLNSWCLFATAAELPREQCNAIAAAMAAGKITWHTAEAFVVDCTEVFKNPWVRRRDDTTPNLFCNSRPSNPPRCVFVFCLCISELYESVLNLPVFSDDFWWCVPASGAISPFLSLCVPTSPSQHHAALIWAAGTRGSCGVATI